MTNAESSTITSQRSPAYSRLDDFGHAQKFNTPCDKVSCGHVWELHAIVDPHACSKCQCEGFLPAYVHVRDKIVSAPGGNNPEGPLEAFPNWLRCDNAHIACSHSLKDHRHMGSLSNEVGPCEGRIIQGDRPCECRAFALSKEAILMKLCADCPHVEEFHVADSLGAVRACRNRDCGCEAFNDPNVVHLKKPDPAINTVMRERERRGDIDDEGKPSEQPAPIHVPFGASMHDRAIEILRERKEFGLVKYGVPLQVGNGRDWGKDTLDEAADWFAYVVGLVEMAQNAIEAVGDQEHGRHMLRRRIEELALSRDKWEGLYQGQAADMRELSERMGKLDADHEEWQKQNKRLRQENEERDSLIGELDATNDRLRRLATLKAQDRTTDNYEAFRLAADRARNAVYVKLLHRHGIDPESVTNEEIATILSNRLIAQRSEALKADLDPRDKAQSDADNAQATKAAEEHDRREAEARDNEAEAEYDRQQKAVAAGIASELRESREAEESGE